MCYWLAPFDHLRFVNTFDCIPSGKHGVYYEKQGTDRDEDDAGKLIGSFLLAHTCIHTHTHTHTIASL